MKKITLLIMVLLVTVILVACGGTANNGERIDFSETLQQGSTIRVWIDDEDGDYMEAVIAAFNEIHPNIRVVHQHMGSVEARDRLKTFGPSGNGADVFQFPHDHLAQAILEDLVYALPSAVRNSVAERAHPLGLDIATLFYDENAQSFDPNSPNAQERLYAVPMSIESVGLYYNTDLISTPHTTYEELLAAAATWNSALNADESGRTNAQVGHYYLGNASHWADSYFVQHIFSAFDWTPFGPDLNDPTNVGFEQQGMQDALAWIRDELKPRVTGTGNHNSISGGGLFEEGHIPYVIGGPWNVEAFRTAGINFGLAPLPSINGNDTKTYAGAMMAAVYKYSQNTDDAIKFVEFLMSDVAMELQFELKGKLPGLKTELLTNIPAVLEDSLMSAMSAQLESAVPMPTIPEVTHYWGPAENMIINVWNNDMAIATAVAQAEAAYQTLKEQAGS